jgi:hypothetical protein
MIYTEELIEIREKARKEKNWQLSDSIRDELDIRLSFLFDTPEGWLVYHLNEKYFSKKPANMTNRQYVELRIKRDIEAEKSFDAWLYTQKQKQI